MQETSTPSPAPVTPVPATAGAPAKPDFKEVELKDKAVQEGAKLFVEAYKMLIAVCTGSLVLMATFSDKFPKSDFGYSLLRNAVLGFMGCIVCAVLLTAISGQMVTERKYLESMPHSRQRAAFYIAPLCGGCFFLAISELGFYILHAFSQATGK